MYNNADIFQSLYSRQEDKLYEMRKKYEQEVQIEENNFSTVIQQQIRTMNIREKVKVAIENLTENTSLKNVYEHIDGIGSMGSTENIYIDKELHRIRYEKYGVFKGASYSSSAETGYLICAEEGKLQCYLYKGYKADRNRSTPEWYKIATMDIKRQIPTTQVPNYIWINLYNLLCEKSEEFEKRNPILNTSKNE